MIFDQLFINVYPFLDHGLNHDINREKKLWTILVCAGQPWKISFFNNLEVDKCHTNANIIIWMTDFGILKEFLLLF